MTARIGTNAEERARLSTFAGFLASALEPYGVEFLDQLDKCPKDHEYHGIQFVCKNEAVASLGMASAVGGEADWKAACEHIGLDAETTDVLAIQICSSFGDALPSLTAAREEKTAKVTAEKKAAADAVDGRLAELADAGETAYRCGDCEGVYGEDDLIQVRECPVETCQTEFFNGTDNGRNCEGCNRPFTRKVHDRGCPECEPSETEVKEAS